MGMQIPSLAYNKEIQKIKDQIKKLDSEKASEKLDHRAKRAIQREKEKLNNKLGLIKKEQKDHLIHTQGVQKRLEKESQHWIKEGKNTQQINTQMLQHMISKRVVFSAEDAIYCGKFFLKMHDLKTPFFSSVLFLDRIFNDISYVVGTFTEQQAQYYGKFLGFILEFTIKIHSSKEEFNKRTSTHPGFKTSVKKKNIENDKLETIEKQLEYENYRTVCNKWQGNISRAAVTCLMSEDYVQTRNMLVILPRLIPFYPKLEERAKELEAAIQQLAEKEKKGRQDLRAKSLGMLSILKSQAANLVKTEDFHKVTKKSSSSRTVAYNKKSSTSSAKKSDEKILKDLAKDSDSMDVSPEISKKETKKLKEEAEASRKNETTRNRENSKEKDKRSVVSSSSIRENQRDRDRSVRESSKAKSSNRSSELRDQREVLKRSREERGKSPKSEGDLEIVSSSDKKKARRSEESRRGNVDREVEHDLREQMMKSKDDRRSNERREHREKRRR